MTAFPQFASLPIELQRGVWQAALEPEPVVHSSDTEKLRREGPFEAKVYLDFNPVMHACHVSREMARRQLQFRRVEDGACLEPYRDFDPDVDALYFCGSLDSSLFNVMRDNWRSEAARIRHLAVDEFEMRYYSAIAGFVQNLGIFTSLRRVSLVCSDDWWELRDFDARAARVRYRILDCADTETVWQEGAGLGAGHDAGTWSVARSFRDRLMHEFASINPNISDRESVPFNKSSGEFLFSVVPARVEPIRETIPKSLAQDAYCTPEVGELRDLLRDLIF